jgi:UPF0755 protein
LRKRRQNSKSKIYAVLGIALPLTLFLIFSTLYFLLIKPPAGDNQVHVKLERGSTAQDVGRLLMKQEVVRSQWFFRLAARWRGKKKFISGNYDLRQGMTVSEVLDRLSMGPIIKEYTITIPEGFTTHQIAARVSAQTKTDGAEFERLAQTGTKDPGFQGYPFLAANPTMTLEGYLFPKTYTFTENASPRDLVTIMLDQYEEETAGLVFGNNQSALTSHQILTIASLIEAEAKVSEERPLISAVIYNRLAKNMKLQIDATVQYALPERKERLSSEDLKTDSPYNTYLHQGLPPGPICNPGLDSIKAALAPAQVNYLYYVLTDPDGRHSFTDSYQEFLNQKQKAKMH